MSIENLNLAVLLILKRRASCPRKQFRRDELQFLVIVLSANAHALTHLKHAFASDTRAHVHNDLTVTIFHATF